jgi:hypothetical protein
MHVDERRPGVLLEDRQRARQAQALVPRREPLAQRGEDDAAAGSLQGRGESGIRGVRRAGAEIDVEGDGLRAARDQLVHDRGMNGPRPRPDSDRPETLFVDVDERHGASRGPAAEMETQVLEAEGGALPGSALGRRGIGEPGDDHGQDEPELGAAPVPLGVRREPVRPCRPS